MHISLEVKPPSAASAVLATSTQLLAEGAHSSLQAWRLWNSRWCETLRGRSQMENTCVDFGGFWVS